MSTKLSCSPPHAPNLGLTDKERGAVISLLDRALANEVILLIKTRKMHWDIGGPQFLTLHQLWGAQRAELDGMTDVIAERIRVLGGYPTATATGFLQLTSLAEHPGSVPRATAAVCFLLTDHELVIQDLRTTIDACEASHDRGTAELLTRVMRAHETMAWTLRSLVSGSAVTAEGDAFAEVVPALA